MALATTTTVSNGKARVISHVIGHGSNIRGIVLLKPPRGLALKIPSAINDTVHGTVYLFGMKGEH